MCNGSLSIINTRNRSLIGWLRSDVFFAWFLASASCYKAGTQTECTSQQTIFKANTSTPALSPHAASVLPDRPEHHEEPRPEADFRPHSGSAPYQRYAALANVRPWILHRSKGL